MGPELTGAAETGAAETGAAETGAAEAGPARPAAHGVRGFFAGIACLGRGFRLWGTSPRLMLLGALPALIVALVYTAALVALLANLGWISVWLTPFADDWAGGLRITLRVVAAIALVAAAALVAVFTFAAVTLTVGDPFYERIWRTVETQLGEAPQEAGSFWHSAARGISNGVGLLARTVVVGVLVFGLGFIPVVGQTVVPLLGAILGGWYLAVELTGFALDARGLSLKQRRRMLGGIRSQTLGFGLLTYLLFLVPFAAVVVMPAAVAGATLLARSAVEARAARAG